MAWRFPEGPPLASLSKPAQATLAEVLEDPGLTNAITRPPEALLRFIGRNKVLHDLYDVVFTQRTITKATRQAVAILTSTATGIQKLVYGSPVTIERINKFPDTEFSADPLICGRFQRIVYSLVQTRPTDPLAGLDSLLPFVIRQMSCLGIRELFSTLVINFYDRFTFPRELVPDLVDAIATENGFYVSTALLSAVQRRPDFAPLQDDDAIDKLLKAAVASPPLIASTCFQVLELVIPEEPADSAKRIIDDYAAAYDFQKPHLTCADLFAAVVFTSRLPSVIPRLFDPGASTFLSQAIVTTFKKLDPGRKAELASQFDLRAKVIEAFDRSLANGHITQLAQELEALGDAESDEWTDFVEKRLRPRVKQRDTPDIEEVRESPFFPDEIIEPVPEASSVVEIPPPDATYAAPDAEAATAAPVTAARDAPDRAAAQPEVDGGLADWNQSSGDGTIFLSDGDDGKIFLSDGDDDGDVSCNLNAVVGTDRAATDGGEPDLPPNEECDQPLLASFDSEFPADDADVLTAQEGDEGQLDTSESSGREPDQSAGLSFDRLPASIGCTAEEPIEHPNEVCDGRQDCSAGSDDEFPVSLNPSVGSMIEPEPIEDPMGGEPTDNEVANGGKAPPEPPTGE
jgi:hypothetical protein